MLFVQLISSSLWKKTKSRLPSLSNNYTATAIPFIYAFSGNCAASALISGPHFSSSRKGRPIVGIYNSLTDTWILTLGLVPQYSFSGNICFKFSVSKFQFSAFCLCSVYSITILYISTGWLQTGFTRPANNYEKQRLNKLCYYSSPWWIVFICRYQMSSLYVDR